MSLDYGYARVNAYRESGTYSSNLSVRGQNGQSLVLGLGSRGSYEINETNRVAVQAMVGYDFAAKPHSLTATDVNGISLTTAADRMKSVVTRIGVAYEIKPVKDSDARLRASYDYFWRSNGYRSNLLNLSMIVPFN
jgi:outer membrane autotransporter protein